MFYLNQLSIYIFSSHELLQTAGFVYIAEAKHFIGMNQTFFGVSSWLHSVQGKYHVFSET